MKKFLALLLALCASVAFAQTTVAPGGAVFNNANGVFVGYVNRQTGVEELLGRRVVQTTPPTCSTNCGTSPSVAGDDTDMVVTMGASGSPASGWVVTFTQAWPAAPACVVQMALTGMVIGKMVLTAVTTTTTVTMVTNGTAPANSDKYAVICRGVS